MNDLISFSNTVLQKIGNYSINSNIRRVMNKILEYQHLSDEELKNKIYKFVSGDFLDKKRKIGIFEKISNSINSIFFRNSPDETNNNLLAIAIEAFKRAPADLPMGSSLYHCQIRAATAVTQNCLVQMDTGEGKTYAILPATFALLCKYYRVYIICANEYLAERDAKRSLTYWDFLGIDVGLALYEKTEKNNWNCRVIYTTLSSILFKYMSDQIGSGRPDFPIEFTSIVIDEADAVMLDQSGSYHHLINYIKSDIYDWSTTLDLAQYLKEGVHVEIDHVYKNATLTLEGEKYLKEKLAGEGYGFVNYELLRKATEIAYVALHVVKENKDYYIQLNRIHPFDPVSGKILYNQTRDWIIPLEFLKGYKTRPEQIVIHAISPNIFLKKFVHKSGLSGTLTEDILEYLFSYMLPTIIIPPRKRRYKGEKNDQVYKTKNSAINALIDDVETKVLEQKRPVLIGTQTIEDAELIHNKLMSFTQIVSNTNITLAKGKDDENIARIFSNGGQIGSIIITTQLGGRGVDIRLTDRAKENGGLALFGLQRSRQIRHDRQFLGRGGRQGDPFTSVFYLSLDDELMKIFGSENITPMLEKIGMEEDIPIEHSFLTKAVVKAQRQIRKTEFINRRAFDYIEYSLKNIYNSMKVWFNLFHTCEENNHRKYLSDSFLNSVIEDFVSNHIEPFITNDMNYRQAEDLINKISETLQYNIDGNIAKELEGRHTNIVVKQIKNVIYSEIIKARTEYYDKNEKYMNIFMSAQKDISEIKEVCNLSDELLYELNNTIENNKGFCNKKNRENFKQFYELLEITPIDINKARVIRDKITRLLDITVTKDLSHAELIDLKEFATKLVKHLYSEFDLFRKSFNLKIELIYKSARRNPREISHRIILNNWIDFLRQKDRLQHAISKRAKTNLENSRNYAENLSQEWEFREINLSKNVLSNILLCNRTEQLDKTFLYEDSRVEMDDSNLPEKKLSWDLKREKILFSESKSREEFLIDEFIRGNFVQIKNDLMKESIHHLLVEFLNQSLISSLQSSDKIYIFLKRWYKKEILEGVSKKRRKKNHIWIKKFLLFLYKKNYIASFPGFRSKINIGINNLRKNLLDTKTSLQLIQLILALSLFAGFTLLGKWIEPKSLSGIYMYVDLVVFGGLISAGVITAPIFGGILFSNIISSEKVSRLFGLVFTLVFSVWFIWEGFSFLKISKFVLFLLIIVYLYSFMFNAVNSTKNLLGIQPIYGWIIYCIVFLLIPKIFPLISIEIFIIMMICISYMLWYFFYNAKEFLFLSTHLSGSSVSMKSENIQTGFIVEGSAGSIPHIYSFIFTFICISFMKDNNFLLKHLSSDNFFLFSIIIYLMFVLLISKQIINTRLSSKLWTKKLHDERLILIQEEGLQIVEKDLNEALKETNKLFIRREFSFQLIIILFASIFLFRSNLPFLEFPSLLLIVTVSIIAGELLGKFYVQIKNALITRLPTSFEIIDLSKITPPKEERSLIEKIKDFFEPTNRVARILRLILTILIIIKFLLDIKSKIF